MRHSPPTRSKGADSDRVTIIHNIAQDMSDPGVVLENVNHSYVAFNDVTGNEAGIALSGSSDNLVERNEAGGTTGTAIEVGEFSEANRIVANQVSANSGSGVSVGGSAPPGRGNLIEGNIANGNNADGIYIGGTGHVITGNRADDNDGWGIYSAQGTISGFNIDGGGNRAVGNAVPDQCYLVSCDGGAPLPSDTTPPETAIESGPAAQTTARRANIAFSGTDNATAVRFECRLDSQQPDGFVPCTSPAQFTNLGLGQHTFEVRAVDYLGNADPTPAVHQWEIVPTVPGIPPETTLTSGPDPVTVRTTARFTFESDEESAVFECSLDGASFVACLSPVEYTGLSVGPHSFAVRATDADGDTDQTPASASWTVGAAPVPTTVTCGRVVTQSIRVLNDLTGCGGNALVVGAHDITIDLGGRTLAGTGLGAGVVTNGFDRVTITGGAINGFDFGVNLTQGTNGAIVENLTITQSQDAAVLLTGAGTLAQGNTLRTLTIGANVAGVLATGSVGTRVLGGTFADIAGDAVQIAGGSDNEVRGLSITEPSGSGISLLGTTRTTVADNTITGASGDGVTVGEELAPSNDNIITGNRSSTSGGSGVAITASRGNLVVGNTLTSAGGGGITLFQADDNTVRGNDAGGNSGGGIDLNQSNDNRIEQNAVNGGSGGIGLDGESNGNLIALNSTNANSGDGIYINGAAPAGRPNILDRNTANGNSQGIFINGAGHVLAGNRADLNDGWGIYAPGAVDGDANQATGNAEPAQCFGITCIIGIPPGAPDTSIVLRPTDPSSSRNAVFTFTGSDNTTEPAGLSFECRLDSTVDTAWVECENPYEITNLSPGMHRFEVRAIDQDGFTDPTPAVATWFYEPLPAGVAPETTIVLRPAPVTPLLEGYFTFASNEPDVTFECQLDGGAWQPCVQAFIYEFEEFEVGQHTFRVRATDAEGLTDPTPATYTWIVSGVVTTITDGPAFVAPGEPGEPAQGGETIERTARFEFTANVADAEFDCSIDLGPFVPCVPGVTYTNLAVGTHSFRIFATDPETGYSDLEPVEYEWVVLPATDVVPPDTDVIGGPDDPTGAATYRFTGTDNVTSPEGLTFECAIDGNLEADFQECVSPWTVPSDTVSEPLTAGPHTLYVRAIDAEGNIDPTPADFPHIYPGDAIAPVAAITSGPSGQTGTTTAVFGLSANDRFATLTCALTGPGGEPPVVQECATGVTFTALSLGTHTLGVVATDLVGNVGPEAVRSWTVVAPPETEITDGPSQTEVSELRTARFAFTSDQAPAVSYRCSLDGGAFVLCSSPYEVQVTTSGDHTLRVRAQNSFGGVDPTPAEWTWNVQLPPPPAATITDAPEENGIATTATIAFTSDLAGVVEDVTFESSTDGVTFAPCASPVTLTDLAPGEYEFFVRAVHPERGTGAVVSAEWNVQPEPQTTITGAPEATTTDTEAVITFTTGPAAATAAECSVDGEAFAPCTSPLVLTGLAVGDHTVAVRAVDEFGNADPTPAVHAWTVEAPPVDTTPPDTAVGSAPSVTTSATGATFGFTATEPGSTFECALNGGEAAPCTSPTTVSGLADGTHTFTVAAVDAAGNVDPDPAVHTWTVDTVAPQTGIGTAPAALTSATGATFAFTATEPGSTFVCSLDGATATPCTSPRSLSGLAPGTHTFRVQAVDAAGNVDGTPAAHTWTVDTAAPETTIGSAPAASTTATTASFSFTATEPGSAFLCSLDGATATPCTSPVSYSGLAAGAHTFRVHAVDAAGNPDTTPATHSWTVGSACAAGTVTLPSVADAWILSSSASQNKGTDSVLKIASKRNDNARALVRFNLPAIPAGCQVTSARLRLYNGSPKSGRTIQALRLTGAWTEGQVRWSNQPATDPAAATATTTSSANWMEWTVTTQVRGMYSSANNGFLIRDSAENGNGFEQQYHSREKAPDRPPQLVVTFG